MKICGRSIIMENLPLPAKICPSLPIRRNRNKYGYSLTVKEMRQETVREKTSEERNFSVHPFLLRFTEGNGVLSFWTGSGAYREWAAESVGKKIPAA